jgi:ClpP class serine protease
MAGSIGVYAVHHDESALDEALGIRHTVVSAGKYKAEGVYQPLSSEAIQHLQNMVDEMYGHFVDSVARGRGVSAADVRDGFGEGRVVLAREAVRQGMVDRIATLDTVLARHGGRETQIAAVGSAALTEMSAEERHRYDRLLTWRLEQHRDNRDLAAPISPDGGNQ